MTAPRLRQVGFVGAHDPRGEPLTLGALREVPTQHPLDVVVEARGGHLEATQLAAEPGLHAQRTAEVDLETLDLLAVGAGHEHALEADVRDLRTGARVRA